MPQIAQLGETFSSQLFWLVIFFGFVFFVVGRGMVPRVMGTMTDRDKQIGDDLAAAKTARDAADKQEEAWRVRENENRAAARALVAQAKAEALAENDRKLATAQERLDVQLAEAEQRIDASRRSALEEIESVAVEAAQDIVQRLASVKVTKAGAEKAVREALANV